MVRVELVAPGRHPAAFAGAAESNRSREHPVLEELAIHRLLLTVSMATAAHGLYRLGSGAGLGATGCVEKPMGTASRCPGSACVRCTEKLFFSELAQTRGKARPFPTTKPKTVRPSDFRDSAPGKLVDIGNGFSAFVPSPLPRAMSLPPGLTKLLGDTRAKLGRLNEGVGSLPSSQLFLRPFQKREAVLSSRIEGTVTTIDEAFVNDTVETEEELVDDAREVRNYEHALRAGVGALASGRPLNVALLKALHRELLRGVRGEEKQPGALRSRQAYVANRTVLIPDDARFVPPPPLEVVDCLDDFDSYLAERDSDEGLIRVAMAHYQFETIHPFADGNGRTGRLLVALQLVWEGVLDHPFLYVSPTLERRRQAYYDGLLSVSQQGSFLEWAEFFVKAVSDSADETLARFGQLRDLMQHHEATLKSQQSQKPLLLAKHLLASPYVTVQSAARAIEAPEQTAQKTIDKLVDAGILKLTDIRLPGARGRPRKLYRCEGVLAIVRD